MKNILFVCTGNTCRSPLAEGLMRKLAREAELGVEVRSAGVYATDGGSISNHSAAILQEHGEKIDDFSSSILTKELMEWSDLVLTMTLGHKGIVLERFPDATDKTYALKEFVELSAEEQLVSDFDIMDPFGGSIDIYRATALEIEQGLRKLIHQIQQ